MAVVVAMFLNDTSQFIMYEDIEGNCRKFWWRNFLSLQNLYPASEMCLSWSWFLAADFQLMVLTCVLMTITAK